LLEGVEADDAIGGEFEERDAVGEKAAGGFEDAGVLGGVERDASSGREGARPVGEDGVSAFSGAGVEDDAVGGRVEEFGELGARSVEAEPGAGGVAVGAGGVVPGLVGHAQPGVACGGHEGTGGVVVEVRHRRRVKREG